MSRESELYKDKIEVSLDGRQIFYLFFGGAVIVGLVFVLGVMVGRRVEARGHLDQARTKSAVDPLAALDRLEGSGLSFQSALAGSGTSSEVERAIAARADRKAAPLAKQTVKPDPAKLDGEPVKPEPADPKRDKKLDAKLADAKKSEQPTDTKAEKLTDKRPELADGKPVTRPDDLKSDSNPEAKEAKESKESKEAKESKSEARTEPKPDKKLKKPDGDLAETKTRFTLQLSSFQDKHEAEAYLSSVKAAGYAAHLTEAEVSGKGTFYRIRMGTYRSLEAANDAKLELDKSLKKSASVMRL